MHSGFYHPRLIVEMDDQWSYMRIMLHILYTSPRVRHGQAGGICIRRLVDDDIVDHAKEQEHHGAPAPFSLLMVVWR